MSNIEWTDKVWNPVVGCTPVSPGCLNCYAARMARRLEAMGTPSYQPRHVDGGGVRIAEVRGTDKRPVFTGEVRTVPDKLEEPLRWRKPRRVFVNSMSDLFHEAVPDAFIDEVFAVMALCPQHTFQVLTKRPERMRYYANASGRHGAVVGAAAARVGGCPVSFGQWPLPNVLLGVSAEDQQRWDQRVPVLLDTVAAVRFVSAEPLVGPIATLSSNTMLARELDWVIVGGESGPNARPCELGWVREIVRACRYVRTPVFVKQLGSNPINCRRVGGGPGQDIIDCRTSIKHRKGADIDEWPQDLRVRQQHQGVETP